MSSALALLCDNRKFQESGFYMNLRCKPGRGFTLIEVIVAIAIVGILNVYDSDNVILILPSQ